LWAPTAFRIAWRKSLKLIIIKNPSSFSPANLQRHPPQGKVYPFFTITPLGSLLGLIYGFVDGLIVGGAFAWLYNRLNKE